jgi:tetratricopeptide (TPR) repeat protein
MQEIIPSPDSEAAEFAGFNLEEITQLATFAEISKGFSLGFAELNFAADLQLLLKSLEGHRRCQDIQFVVIKLEDPDLEFVLSGIKEELAKVTLDPDKKPVLLVVGLERSIGYVNTGKTPGVIANLNFARNLFPKQLPYPIIFFLPDYALTRLARGAHDFWAWTSASFQFRSSRQSVTQTYQQTLSEQRLFTSDNKPVKQERIDRLQRLLMQYAPTTGNTEAETAPLRLNILEELADAYWSLSEMEAAEQLYTEALDLAQSLGKQWEQANALFSLGNILVLRGNNQEALKNYEAALDLYGNLDAYSGQADTLRAMGDVFQFYNLWQMALNHYQEALQLYKFTGNRSGEANTLTVIGAIHQFYNRFPEALNCYESALSLYENTDDVLGKATALKMIGDVLEFLGQLTESLTHYESALKLYQSIGSQLGEAHTLRAIGNALQSLRQSGEALIRYDKALQLYCSIGYQLGKANTLKSIGDVLQFLGQLQEALNHYEEALSLYREIVDRLGEANTLQAIGDMFLNREDFDQEAFEQAKKYLNTAYRLYCDIDDRYSQARILLTSIIPLQIRQGEIEKAITAVQEAADIAEAIGYEPMQQHADRLLTELTQPRTP